ncbi:MAG: hypothetical protein LBR17_05475 [Bacteroidales bacterium]|jgi:hypothetical protein|nr:hypothetical protein [Bacteroidales bacterium]
MKKVLLSLVFTSIMTTSFAQWRGPAFFEAGKCELGITFGTDFAFNPFLNGWAGVKEFSDFYLMGVDLGLNFSFSLTDWFKISTPIVYGANITLSDGFSYISMLKLPVLASFKVGSGAIGIGFQQNFGLGIPNKLNVGGSNLNLNASCIVLDFGFFKSLVDFRNRFYENGNLYT